MYYIIQYLKHLIVATNQHGVHSPFVYDYLTKCLYSKPKYKTSKCENVLLKSILYFSVERFKIDSKASRIEDVIQKEFGIEASQEAPFDLIYLNTTKDDLLAIHKDSIHNDSVILIKNIHRTEETTKAWEAQKKNELITVSIDMFHCGLLFFRKEQVKEHFKIRI